jgi:hypothetical protein
LSVQGDGWFAVWSDGDGVVVVVDFVVVSGAQ